MFAIFLAVFNTALAWIFREVVIKFVIFAVLFVVVSEFGTLLLSFLPDWMTFTGSFTGVDSGVWYFLDFFQLAFGLPIVISAFVTRFLIRRIPVIG